VVETGANPRIRNSVVDMNNLLCVLGHKIRLLDTDEWYGMALLFTVWQEGKKWP
jgi:hypothetical protein